MGVVLDSSVLIAVEKGTFDAEGFLNTECALESVFITSITASELLHGWERAPTGKKKQARKRFVESILTTYTILDFDLIAARRHAQSWASLEKKGKMIGAHDLLIAAICLARNYEIATLNTREFQQVPGMKLKPTRKYLIP